MSPCPTTYGRRNKAGDGVEMTEWLKEHSVPKKRADKLSPEEIEKSIVTGVFVDEDRPEYTAEYGRLVEKVGGTV
jgi:2-oxoglutarate ferredoxin oxidoreductase subunit beta